MNNLDELIKRAIGLKEQGEFDADLAKQLRLAANQQYGTDLSNKDFQATLALALAVEKNREKKWETKYSIIGKGDFEDDPIKGEFAFKNYTIGKADLYVNGDLATVDHGILIGLHPGNSSGGNVIILKDDLSPRKKAQVKRRFQKLKSFLAMQTGNLLSPENYIFINGTRSYPSSNLFYIDDDLSKSNQSIKIDYSTEERLKANMAQNRLSLENYCGETIGDIRQVGSVRDGGTRYKR